MKSVVIISIKVLLLALFLQNIGFYSFIANRKQETPPPMKVDNGRADMFYLNQKVARAEKMNRDYGPEEYFADLTEIRLKEKRNDFDRLAVLQKTNAVQCLLAVFSNNVKYNREYASEAAYELYMARLTAAQQKHLNIVDPEIQRQEEISKAERQQPGYWSNLFISVLIWLARCYWLNFPLALVLLWLWWYQEKEKVGINNPISFLICLVLYPIVLIRVWSRSLKYGARVFALGIEFKRRQANLFSMISDDEWSLIKKYARSEFKISAYRQNFENLGLVRRHALLPAMMVITIFMLLPKLSSAGIIQTPLNLSVCEYQIKAPPDLNTEKADLMLVNLFGNLVQMEELFIPLLVVIISLTTTPKQIPGFTDNPDPVPLFC